MTSQKSGCAPVSMASTPSGTPRWNASSPTPRSPDAGSSTTSARRLPSSPSGSDRPRRQQRLTKRVHNDIRRRDAGLAADPRSPQFPRGRRARARRGTAGSRTACGCCAVRSTASNHHGWNPRESCRRPMTVWSSLAERSPAVRAVIASIEQGFQGGGTGEVSGAKISQALRLAADASRAGTPTAAILLFETGGVRLQEANLGPERRRRNLFGGIGSAAAGTGDRRGRGRSRVVRRHEHRRRAVHPADRHPAGQDRAERPRRHRTRGGHRRVRRLPIAR